MSAGRTAQAAEIASLRLGYARSLPERLGCLRAAVLAWGRAPDDGELLSRAESLAHRLRGTAGSYGFAAFSATAGAVEDALRRCRAAGTAGDETMAVIALALRAADDFALEAIAILEAGSPPPAGRAEGVSTLPHTPVEEDV
jgi:chemotaxis protein histidine kinase CheA